ncbi:MAG: B12-binding domain-containing radical SAM protein [Planctomycetota bacterium]|jgi:radical SAM superfamily enzyme YgiQ (UPF0313 family)
MDTLLVNVSKKTEVRLPQGLLYLASAIHSEGHKVTILDEALSSNSEKFLGKIIDSKADIIGFSVYSVPWQLKRIEEISSILKDKRPSTPIIWGGWHPTLYPRQSILNRNVDIVVRGPGERILCNVLAALEKKQQLNRVNGIIFKDNEEYTETPTEELSNECLFPPINFKLIDMDAYIKKHDKGSGILQYITSRGCYGRCRFCVVSSSYKRRMFRKPQNQIIDELKWLFGNHTITAIHFSDDNAFRNNAEARELCDVVRSVTNDRGIGWRCATRIDTLSRLSGDSYKSLLESGCRGFSVGIESGADRVLELMGKDVTVSQIEEAMESMLDHKLDGNLFFFLFNFTGETRKESKKSLRLACKMRLLFPYSDIAIYTYFPLMSESTWLPADISESEASRLSEIFQTRIEETLSRKVCGADAKIVQYYFSASRQSETVSKRRSIRPLSSVYKRLINLRIRTCFFRLPFEFFLLEFLRKILKSLRKRSANQRRNK